MKSGETPILESSGITLKPPPCRLSFRKLSKYPITHQILTSYSVTASWTSTRSYGLANQSIDGNARRLRRYWRKIIFPGYVDLTPNEIGLKTQADGCHIQLANCVNWPTSKGLAPTCCSTILRRNAKVETPSAGGICTKASLCSTEGN
jgi:hypothetical protein